MYSLFHDALIAIGFILLIFIIPIYQLAKLRILSEHTTFKLFVQLMRLATQYELASKFLEMIKEIILSIKKKK